MQRRQLARIPPVGLYPIPRPRRHQPGRDNLAIDARTDQMAIKPEPRRARLIHRPRPRPPAQLALNPLVVKGQRELPHHLTRPHRGQTHRGLMHIQPHRDRPSISHGRRPPYVARPRQPTQMRTPPAILTERPDHPAAPSWLAGDEVDEEGIAPPSSTWRRSRRA